LFSGRFSLGEHLEELRRRLRVVAISFLAIFLVVVLFPANPSQAAADPGQYLSLAFISNTVVASFLAQIHSYIVPPTWTLIAASGVGEPMEVYFVAALLLSVALDMPVIAYETYKFIDPALREKERKMIYPFVGSTSLLFVVGLLFGYFVLAKFLVIALQPFFAATGTAPDVDLGAFYYVVFLIIGASGVSFTSPVFVYTLIRFRVLSAEFFAKNRVIIWFVIWVATGLFLTPDGGPLLDLVIFIPIVAMVEAAVMLAKRGGKEEGATPPSEKKWALKCPSCGLELKTPMLFCPKCGKSVA
jgi:sec-independent protein translocase protein TatC